MAWVWLGVLICGCHCVHQSQPPCTHPLTLPHSLAPACQSQVCTPGALLMLHQGGSRGPISLHTLVPSPLRGHPPHPHPHPRTPHSRNRVGHAAWCVQAGARKVYAVEASGMARCARRLADGNPALGSRIQVINSKVEEVVLSEKVGHACGCVRVSVGVRGCVWAGGCQIEMDGGVGRSEWSSTLSWQVRCVCERECACVSVWVSD